MAYDSLLDLVKKRRSTRRFKPDPVADGDIDKILEAARWAPSGFNLQPWEFVVVRDEELKNGIADHIHSTMAMMAQMESAREPWQGAKPPKGAGPPPMGFGDAPVFILCFGDMRTRDGLPMIHRYSEESWERTLLSSLASAFLYMHLAATSLGLATQWLSAVTQPAAHCGIKQLLGIPAPLRIYDMMVLGYPDMETPPRPVRNREDFVHRDFCGEDEFRNDEEVRQFIYNIRNPKPSP